MSADSRPLVSIVIPTFNSETYFEICLRSVADQTHGNTEIIVVDSYSTDNTRKIAERYGAKTLLSRELRSRARNIGADSSKGQFILFIDSDMELASDLVESCILRIKRGCDAIIVPEISVGTGFWTECKALEKICYFGDDSIEAARFFKKEVFGAVGGYDPRLEACEDWDINQRVEKAGFRIARTSAIIKHHEGELNLREAISKKNYYGKTLKLYTEKHPAAARKQLTLVRPAFIRNWRRLLKHPTYSLGMFLMKSCEFLAGLLGSI